MEYVSSTKWLKDKYGVTRYSTKTGVKSSIAEISLKSVLAQVYRKMYIDNTVNWESTIKEIEESQNNRKRDSLMGFSPNQILSSEKNINMMKKKYAKRLIDNEMKYGRKRPKQFDIRPGDTVRYRLRKQNVFTKSYVPRYSKSTATVAKKSDAQSPPVFYLNSPAPKDTPYYAHELSLVLSDDQDEGKNDLFIDGQKKLKEKSTRSGKAYAAKTLYLLKSRQRPQDTRYITETERDNLIRKGLLKND